MFPTPVQKTSSVTRLSYQALLPVALVLWLLPLIAVAVFSIRPDADFANANYWGWPSAFNLAENYGAVFFRSDMPRYLLNSVLITVPTVIGAVGLACMTGFALGVYRFKANLAVFFVFVAGNFVPFQILMCRCASSRWISGSTTPRRASCSSTSPSRRGSARCS